MPRTYSTAQKAENARRQREYRQRHLKDGLSSRLNTVLGVQAKARLDRLCRYHQLTQGELLGQLLAEEDSRVSDALSADEQREYYDGVTR